MIKILSHEIIPFGPYYGGRNGFERKVVASIESGDSCNQQVWSLNNHTGTHVDCPRHFSVNGYDVTDYSAEDWVFSKVCFSEIEVENDMIIQLEQVSHLVPEDCDAFLLKTNFEKFRGSKTYWNNNPGMSPELGQWLRTNRPALKLIGFDFISITSFQDRPLGRIAHKAFLEPTKDHPGLRVVEDMKLSEIDSSPNQLIVSPVNIKADGSPVTVFAFFN